jgi:hypothetical protein
MIRRNAPPDKTEGVIHPPSACLIRLAVSVGLAPFDPFTREFDRNALLLKPVT